MIQNIHTFLDIFKPLRKRSAEFKIYNVHRKNYTPELWEDIERVKKGLDPLHKMEGFEDIDNSKKPTRLHFSVNNEGFYDKYDISILIGIKPSEVISRTKRGFLKKDGYIVKRLKK